MIVKITPDGDFEEVAQRPKKKKYTVAQIREYIISDPGPTASQAVQAAIKRDSAKFRQITDLSAKLAAMGK